MLEIVPGDADHVTATFEVLLTKAVNCKDPADGTVGVDGVTVTATVEPLTVSAKDLVAVCFGEEESDTWTVKLN